jgi:hypothetical protein
MRGDVNWTGVNEIEYQGWRVFESDFCRWMDSLPADSEVHDMDFYHEQVAAYFSALDAKR